MRGKNQQNSTIYATQQYISVYFHHSMMFGDEKYNQMILNKT